MKQTEIGMIPDDWEVKELGELGSFSKGTSISKEESNSGNIPAIRYGELYTHHNNYIKTFYSHISSEVAKKAKQLKKGDLLFTCSGETKEDIGKCVAFISDEEAYAGGDLIILSPNIEIDSTYFGFLLNTDFCVKQKSSYGQGDAVVHISAESIKKVKIPLPPTIAEQQKIAKALSDVDNVISTLEKLITKKKNLKQGTMQQLLTGKKRLPGFGPAVVEPVETPATKQTELGEIPADWEVKELKDLCENFSYGVGAEAKKYDGINKYIRITDINEDSHLFSPESITSPNFYSMKSIVKENDILIARTGASVGKSYIYTKDDGRLIFAGFLMRCNVVNADSKFVFYNSLTERYWNWVASESMRSGQPGLNLEQLKKFLIALPSKPEQTAIANVLFSMDKEIEALNTKLEKYRNLKTGMMQQLLTGKIRL